MTEEKLREEAKRLMEDKEKYQVAAKDNLKNLGNHIFSRDLTRNYDLYDSYLE